MSTRKRRWFWGLLFAAVMLVLGTLATGWNIVLIQNYYRMLEVAKSLPNLKIDPSPWFWAALGTLGFLGTLGAMVLFFVRLLQEMRLNQLQSEFLAALTHELKTPLATLELSSSLLKKGGLSDGDVQKLWSTHEKDLQRLRTDVETLLEAARWQSGPPPVVLRDKIILEKWLHEHWSRWSEILGPGATLKREGAPLEVPVLVEIRAFNIIFENLIENARKYSKGSPVVTVTTQLEPSGAWSISFRDEGLGFLPSDAKKIFQRFFRGRQEASKAIPGTGLGLFLAHSAAKSLGLNLKGFSSGRGLGATFILEPKNLKKLKRLTKENA